MNKNQWAIDLIKDTFQSKFDKAGYIKFIKSLLNEADFSATFSYKGNLIFDDFEKSISLFERVAKYSDGEDEIDVLIVHLRRDGSVDRARTMQRNFIAKYLSRKDRKAALVAFVAPNGEDWRFSLVKLEVRLEANDEGQIKLKDEFTPARRWSFLVGSHEKSHTAQKQFVPMMADTDKNPTLAQLEEAFNIEKVTKEFFEKYRGLFIWTKDELDKTIKKNAKTKSDFESKGIDTVNLAKKLLGQIVFLYYLQKKGWFGVPTEAAWGEGSKNFLRELFEKKHGDYKNFFNDILEPLFYDALRMDRSHDDHYYRLFDCKIPFLNGGLFDPMNNYDWVKTEILLSNELFSNKNKTDEGDTGDGILDIFDRYNFTVKEDEPFEKEVAIDPELLGKAYEKFNAIRPDNYGEFLKALKSGKKGEESKFNKQYGVYYTPREIVHYMCQQSLINYLHTELNPKVAYQALGDENLEMFGNTVKTGQFDLTTEHAVEEFPKEAIALLIQHGEDLREHEAQAADKKTATYSPIIAESIRKNAALIDEKLANIKVCDPAVGSGAFPVGMMSEIVRARDVLKTWSKTKKTVYDFKRECIENSLYGVDIDSGAVEIAKLRLWLSLVVDEDNLHNINPLPNLDYKILCGDSLIGVEKNLFNHQLFNELEQLKPIYLNETQITKKQELKKNIDFLINKITNGFTTFDFETYFSEVFHNNNGFHVVIANPPYVSTKGREETDRKSLLNTYGFTDDLYTHFYFKGIEIATSNNGLLCFISSKTFWTIQTKKNLRELLLKNKLLEIYDTADPFDAMVDTSIVLVQKAVLGSNNEIVIKDGRLDLLNPKTYKNNTKIFQNAPNKVFFIPNSLNMKIYNRFSSIVKKLMEEWWDKISTSKNLEKNKKALNLYRNALKPGDITLLGLITDGGVGLQTGNNGRYVGVIKGTKISESVIKSRSLRLFEFIASSNIKKFRHLKDQEMCERYLDGLTEEEIRGLFDQLKEEYGRDIFGQGYLHRIVNSNEIANVSSLSDDEKLNGIKGKKVFVPYDKGDKEGNRWYSPTPYYIEWSREKVRFMQEDPKARWQGYQFFFREGFCWTNVLNPNARLIKARYKDVTVNDVGSMALSSSSNLVSDKFLVTLLNSNLLFDIYRNFINQSVNVQINDIRQLPIVIPTPEQLEHCGAIFDMAKQIQVEKFGDQLTPLQAEKQLEKIQDSVDQLVYKLYGLAKTEPE